MRISIGPLLILIIIFSQTISIAQTENLASLHGKVYASGFGALLSNIRIQIISESEIVRTALSDEEGNYRIINLTSGKYTIVVAEEGFARKQLHLELNAGEQVSLDIAVNVGEVINYSGDFEISGKVNQLNGNPIGNAKVFVLDAFTSNLVAQTKTNAKGEYRAPAKQGQFVVFVSRPGYLTRSVSILLHVTSPDEKRRIDFMLESYNKK